jgi:peroxiredoxin
MQLRREYSKLTEAGIEVVVVGPDDLEVFVKHCNTYELPYVGIPDPDLRLLDLYGQRTKLLRGGQMPAQVLLDSVGIVQMAHYGDSMTDITSVGEILKLVASLSEQ